MEKQSGQLIAGRYRLHKVIGRGGFGDVYQAEDTATPQQSPLVCKLEKVSNQEDATLIYEAKIMEYLKDVPAVPKILAYGSERDYTYCVMDNCGIPISAIHRITGSRFDAKVAAAH